MLLKNKITVLSFDMGKAHTGWSLLEYDILKNKFTVLKIGEIKAANSSSKAAFKEEVALYGEPVVTFDILEKEIDRLVKLYSPDYAASEGAWSRQFVTAFVALTLCIFVASKVMKKYGLCLYEISPPQAKACLVGAGKGHSGKEEMRTSILNHENIKFADDIETEKVTEHSFDSISIGYTFCIRLLPAIILEAQSVNEKKEKLSKK